MISGCQDNQTSADGTFNGLFTGTLLHRVALAVAVPARAGVTLPAGQRISADVVVCGDPLDCVVADWIVPSGWLRSQRQIVIEGAGDRLAVTAFALVSTRSVF